MFSGTRPHVDQGGVKLVWLATLAILTAVAAMVWRRRYRGVQLLGYIGQGIWRD
jgi:hypothetical protein